MHECVCMHVHVCLQQGDQERLQLFVTENPEEKHGGCRNTKHTNAKRQTNVRKLHMGLFLCPDEVLGEYFKILTQKL